MDDNSATTIKVSRFDPFMNKDNKWMPGVKPIEDDLYKQLNYFRDGYYANTITTLRNMREKKDRDVYKQEKLPAFTFSALIDKHRNSKNIKQHTGILVIDIDNEGFLPYLKKRREEQPDYSIENFRDEISRFDNDGKTNVLFAGLSASGTGLFLLFVINPEQHLDCFYSIEWELLTHYGIKVDPACKDVTRLRFCTYDPDAVIRELAQVTLYSPPKEYLKWRDNQNKRLEDLKKKPRTFTSNATAATHIVDVAVSMIDNAQEGSRHNTILKAARLMGGYVATGVLEIDYARSVLQAAVREKAFASQGLDLDTELKAVDDGLMNGQHNPIHLHILSPDDPQYLHFVELNEESQRNFKQFYIEILQMNRAGLPFPELDFDPLCRTYGIDHDRAQAIASRLYRLNSDEHDWDHMTGPIKLRVFINKRWEIRRNIVTHELFIRVRNSGNVWKQVKVEDMWITICEQRFKFSFEDLNRLLQTDMVSSYNPFVDYFNKVKSQWDGTNYIKQLADCIEIRNIGHEYFYAMLKKMLIRTVKCALEEHYVNRYVFVLSSIRQNTGKSWLIRWLSPWGMSAYYAENPLGENKDDRIRMSEVFIYNLEELTALTKKDVNVLKQIISSGSSKERRAYERLAQTFPRRCSFFGSTNRSDFLLDDSNSRWLIFEVGDIKWEYSEKIDIANLWGQVYNLYLNGEEYEMDKNELATQEAINEKYVDVQSEDTLLERFFMPTYPEHTQAILMTATDICQRLQELCNNPKLIINMYNVGRALRRQQYIVKYVNKIRCYAVIPINQSAEACINAKQYEVNRIEYENQYEAISDLWSNHRLNNLTDDDKRNLAKRPKQQPPFGTPNSEPPPF